jgi:hypothetical protein
MATLPINGDSNQVLAYKAAKNLWDIAVLIDSTLKEPLEDESINQLYANIVSSTEALSS